MAAEQFESPPAIAESIEPVKSRVLDRSRALRERLEREQLTPELAEALRAGFVALGTEPSREGADLLCDFIADPRLAKHEATDGVALRSHATEALLRMGYPYALEISPEAMAGTVAERHQNERRRPMLRLGGFLVLGAAVLDALPLMFLPSGTAMAVCLVAAFAIVFTLTAADLHPMVTWSAGGLLFLAGFAQTFLGFVLMTGDPGLWLLAVPLLAVGLAMAGGAAVALAAPRKSPPPPVIRGELLDDEDAVLDP